jgi:hypothetical protein
VSYGDNLGAAVAAIAALVLAGSSALAHEFWIAPRDGTVAAGAEIVAELKVGTMLRGEPYPYLSNRFRSFTVTVREWTAAVDGDEGDMPALAYATGQSGLHVIAQHTIDFRVTYEDWAVFRRYLAEEGLDRFADLHRARDLPDSGFSERYTRHAKALVQVGPVDPTDRDVRIGLPLELVAEANPYAAGVGILPVVLTWQGAPVANRLINVFRDDGTVTRTTVTTDETGRAMIPLAGNGEYLLNAVRLQAVEDAPVAWASHWATLSFKLRRDG